MCFFNGGGKKIASNNLLVDIYFLILAKKFESGMSKIKEILSNCLKRINIQIFVFLFFFIATIIVSFFHIEEKNAFVYELYGILCGFYFSLCLFYPIIYIVTLVFVKKEYIKKILLFLLYLVTFYLSFLGLYLL